MNEISKYSHQIITGISFGVTSGVITALGMIVGLHEATSSKIAVLAGIVIMAIADGLADAAGFHITEEAEFENGKPKHTPEEVWMTTVFTFIAVCGFILTFAVPILVFQLQTAIIADIAWGLLLLVLLNFYIARFKKENPVKLTVGHVSLALFVIFVSYLAGNLISAWIG
ncbi:MAG TPA: hypothetical protein VIO58_13885 [Candidatus Methanoperedens sp.]